MSDKNSIIEWKNQKGRARPVDRPVGRKQWWLEKQQWNRAPVRSWMRCRNEQLLGWFNPFSRSFYVTELLGFHLLRWKISQLNSLFLRCYNMTLWRSNFLICSKNNTDLGCLIWSFIFWKTIFFRSQLNGKFRHNLALISLPEGHGYEVFLKFHFKDIPPFIQISYTFKFLDF